MYRRTGNINARVANWLHFENKGRFLVCLSGLLREKREREIGREGERERDELCMLHVFCLCLSVSMSFFIVFISIG